MIKIVVFIITLSFSTLLADYRQAVKIPSITFAIAVDISRLCKEIANGATPMAIYSTKENNHANFGIKLLSKCVMCTRHP